MDGWICVDTRLSLYFFSQVYSVSCIPICVELYKRSFTFIPHVVTILVIYLAHDSIIQNNIVYFKKE